MTALNELKPLVQDRVLEFVEELGKRASPPSEEKEASLDLAMWMSNFASVGRIASSSSLSVAYTFCRVDFMGDMVFVAALKHAGSMS